MGKSEEDLRESRKIRADFVAKYGLVPQSILKHDRHDRPVDIAVLEGRSYSGASRTLGKKMKEISSSSQFEKLNKQTLRISARFVQKGIALSTFPQNIGRFFVQLYCPEGGTVYDPFAGHNSRMYLVYSCNKNYIGVDVSHKFMEANWRLREAIAEIDSHKFLPEGGEITLYEQSSASVPQVGDNTADYTITSPPYYQQEYYGDEPEQLGNAKTYESFLKYLLVHVKENFRVLKPGSFCTWFVNDFMHEKVYRCYHADLIGLFKEAGFTLHDIAISDLGHALTSLFVKRILVHKRLPKRHEYGLTFKKPVRS